MKQVNVVYRLLDDETFATITDFAPDGYVGKLTDTSYVDGADTTNWRVFAGTEDECKQWIKDHSHELWRWS